VRGSSANVGFYRVLGIEVASQVRHILGKQAPTLVLCPKRRRHQTGARLFFQCDAALGPASYTAHVRIPEVTVRHTAEFRLVATLDPCAYVRV